MRCSNSGEHSALRRVCALLLAAALLLDADTGADTVSRADTGADTVSHAETGADTDADTVSSADTVSHADTGADTVSRADTLARNITLGSKADNANEESEPFAVSAVAFDEGAESGAALALVLRAVLRRRGVSARVRPPPAVCAAPDTDACRAAILALLARGALAAALLPAPRAPPPPLLRDAGLEELADAAPPAHRACHATGGGARSLLDLADRRLAALYVLSREDVENATRACSVGATPRFYCGAPDDGDDGCTLERETSYATVVVGPEAEAALVLRVARDHGLRVRAASVAPACAACVLAALAPRRALACGRALPHAALARAGAAPLGPPPCLSAECPFEARRLLKLVNVRELAHAPTAIRALGRVALDESEMARLARRALEAGPAAAAREALAAHVRWAGGAGEVRAAVMIPVTSAREAHDADALRAAAELAEIDANARPGRAYSFKVETLDDGCSGSLAFKHLTDALGSEFGALSAVAGPACGGAFGDVLRQSGGLALPVLAYTAQAAGGEGRLALLAAGDARAAWAAWGAVLATLGWRRLAVLSDAGSRAALQLARLDVELVAHVELPEDAALDGDLVAQWARRAAEGSGRIVAVFVQDARAVRAALCAGRAAGLRPARGAVWLLPGALPPGWLRPAPRDAHNCSAEQLRDTADGHLSLAWRWAARWERSPDAAAAWRERWRARCAACSGAAPASAALLYDALRLWAAALDRLAAAAPAALDDLHRDDVAGSLVKNAISVPYEGLTGAFEWEAAGAGAARSDALELRQWSAGGAAPVGEWRRGALTLRPAALRWRTRDGGAPDDGSERCALQALADALRADCRVAFGVACALPLAALAALLAAAAARWRRRARREYRARVAALGMRALGPKPGGLDRWEVPRERVVINRKLGTGAFGTVYGGHALLAEERGWTAVAVKTLKAGASTDEKLDFLSEAEAMKRFEHRNVVRLLGVVTETEPVCTVMEFMLYGDLKSYLVARRQLAGASEEVSAARLTALATDAARALAYLARLRYVHRDVAARNCLVSAHRSLKLADFGMTRLVFEHDYYRFSRKGMLPVRWMAPESLALGVFSPASDVWSYGVLLYEIVTFGSLPFQGLSNSEVLARVKAGGTLDLPAGIRPQLEGVISSCWRRERSARPTAAALAATLADCPRLLQPCVDAPLDALPLALEPAAAAAAAAHDQRAETRWVSWTAPTSAATDCTYLSAEGAAPRETDAFLPPDSA